jgi:negative regulator of flagellin synthesis FlgM
MKFDPRENANRHAAPRGSRDWPRESSAMYIYGTGHVHTAQPLAAPHRMAPAQATSSPYSSSGIDQLDISPKADYVAQARELPDIREDRVAAIREQIKSGAYETPEKLDLALSRLLDEFA